MGNWTNPNIQSITSLAQQGSVSGNPAATIVAGTGYTVINLQNVAQFASYDINCYGYASPAGGNLDVISFQMNLQWFDDLVSGIPVFEEDWFFWAGRAAPVAGTNYLAGSGPMHGQYMTVTVFIPPGATGNGILQYINLFGSNRVVPYSDWRQSAQFVDPQIFNLQIQGGGGTSFDNFLASVSSATLAVSTAAFIPLGLYSGPVYYRYQSSVAASNDPVIACLSAQVGGQPTFGTGTPGLLVNMSADAAEHEGTFLAPRGPCAFIFRSPASGTFTYSFTAVAQQAA